MSSAPWVKCESCTVFVPPSDLHPCGPGGRWRYCSRCFAHTETWPETKDTSRTSKQLCKHDWVGDDNCAYCALEEANESLAKYAAWAESCEPAPDSIRAEFKNFHRLLCERFGYVHDGKDWQRDQLSLIEHIAKRGVHETTAPKPCCMQFDTCRERCIPLVDALRQRIASLTGETECDAEDAAIARELTKNLSAQVDHIQHLKNMLSLAYQLLLDQRRPTLEQEQMIRDSFVSQLHEERQKAMPSEPEPKLCAHEWTHQTADIWCCECCGIFQRRGLPEKSSAEPVRYTIKKPPQEIMASASTDDTVSPSRAPPSSVECPKCRTQLAFEGDTCGLCQEEAT